MDITEGKEKQGRCGSWDGMGKGSIMDGKCQRGGIKWEGEEKMKDATLCNYSTWCSNKSTVYL